MARLFGKEYHDHSNSWYFKSSVINLERKDIELKKYRNEKGRYIFEFRTIGEKSRIFPLEMQITYDLSNKEIIDYSCRSCSELNCRHYLSILNFAYHYLTTEDIVKDTVQTYSRDLLEYDEFWQQIVINSKIEISDIFNNQNDKIRFHFASYQPMHIRLISILADKGSYREEDLVNLKSAQKEMKALSQSEIEILALLHKYKCSYSRKSSFFTIYKKDFQHFFSILTNLQYKTIIKETGELITFTEDDFRINFIVSKKDETSYVCRLALTNPLSAFFIGSTTWVFFKNRIAGIKLPFRQEIAQAIFNEGYILQKEDLPYFSSVIARQLALIKCYIDFDENIDIPLVYHNFPRISLYLFRHNDAVVMEGRLKYNSNAEIPLSIIKLPVQLARFDHNYTETWFYIPPQIKHSMKIFFQKLPKADEDLIEESSQLVYKDQKAKDELKKAIFEFADPAWEIILSDDLKKEFIYKVNLEPVIETRKSADINWFEYDVQYKYKDIAFSHEELRKFFKTKNRYLKLEDGRLLYFQNKEAFDEVEKLVKASRKSEKSESWKLAVYNLTYIYQLPVVNRGINIKGDAFLDSMVADILQRHLDERTNPIPTLQPVMRSYQKAGYRWLKMLQKYSLAGILADDMGLGKTLEALSLLADLDNNVISLVICPKTLVFNWAAEIDKFCPFLSYIIYEGSQKERRKLLKNPQANIIIASYSIIPADLDVFSELNYEYIILDEAQHIKNVGAQRTKAIKKLSSNHRLCLTGTPVENNTSEIWSLFDFLMPGYLPPQNRFRDLYSDEAEKSDKHKLRLLISPFILRRKKEDVLIELPDKQIQTVYCKLTSLQEKLYLQILTQINKEYFSAEASPGKNFLHILAALTKMRQICNHPALINPDIKDDPEFSGKIELLQELITDAVASGRKLLIFSQFVGMLQIIKKFMQKTKIPFEYMDGSSKNRQKKIENFNHNNKIRAFLISLKTGGYGLNLTAADTVIITDPWWNPMGENQAIDRAHRIGQTKKVIVYKTITRSTIEEKIQQLQISKKHMFVELIEKGESLIKSLDATELKELLQYPKNTPHQQGE